MRLLALLLFLAAVPAIAEEDALKEGFKKTEKGMGNLLRGMGQEINKIGGSLTSGKKDRKKDPKKEAKAQPPTPK